MDEFEMVCAREWIVIDAVGIHGCIERDVVEHYLGHDLGNGGLIWLSPEEAAILQASPQWRKSLSMP